MPHGFFTVEQWKRSQDSATTQWIPVLHLDSYQSLTRAIAALEKRGLPALLDEVVRAVHLDAPDFGRALGVAHFELNRRVRVGPREFLHRAAERLFLAAIEHHGRVMRDD